MPLEPPMVYVTEPMAWEYKYLRRKLRKDGVPTEKELNAMGKEGWELAAAFSDSEYVHVYFKRPVGDSGPNPNNAIR